MALFLKHTSGTPLGEFDALDSDLALGFLGGEVVTFGSVVVGNSVDKSTADTSDGYIAPNKRVVVTKQLGSSAATPLMLADDGLQGYGVTFGVVVGGTAGQTAYGPAFSPGAGVPLGPPTYAGSGKITCWATPGVFGVTLDNVDPSITPTSAACVPGAKLYAVLAGGQLCLSGGASHTGNQVATFIDFETNGSLVTTPNRLVSALNSPSTVVGGVLPNQLIQAVFSFWPMQ